MPPFLSLHATQKIQGCCCMYLAASTCTTIVVDHYCYYATHMPQAGALVHSSIPCMSISSKAVELPFTTFCIASTLRQSTATRQHVCMTCCGDLQRPDCTGVGHLVRAGQTYPSQEYACTAALPTASRISHYSLHDRLCVCDTTCGSLLCNRKPGGSPSTCLFACCVRHVTRDCDLACSLAGTRAAISHIVVCYGISARCITVRVMPDICAEKVPAAQDALLLFRIVQVGVSSSFAVLAAPSGLQMVVTVAGLCMIGTESWHLWHSSNHFQWNLAPGTVDEFN